MTTPAVWSVGRRRGARIVAAAAALAIAWVATPHAVPLYDGIGQPDEPYRYVSPPAGYQKTPPPTSATASSPGAGGTNTKGFYANTSEVSAQFGVFVIQKTLVGPAGTQTFKVTATPEAPAAGKTPFGTIDGNVYKVQLWADGSPTATLNDAGLSSDVYSMRATSAKIPAATFLYRATPNADWTSYPSQRLGTDSFQAYLHGSGEYALTPAQAKKTSSSHTLVIVILVLVVLAMVVAVVLIRLSRRPSAQP